MQSEFDIHFVMDLPCSVLDLMFINTMNAIVKTCNIIRDKCRCEPILQCLDVMYTLNAPVKTRN